MGDRLVGEGVPSYLLVGDRALPLRSGDPGVTSTQVAVAVEGLPPGTYPVSIRVAGAESIDPHTFQVTP